MIKSDYIDNSFFLYKLYQDRPPFDKLQVSDINFLWDGPSIKIVFHTSRIPKHLPEKWDQLSNRIRFSLYFVDIDDLDFNKWGKFNDAECMIEICNDTKQVTIIGEECYLKFNCKWIRFENISSYISK